MTHFTSTESQPPISDGTWVEPHSCLTLLLEADRPRALSARIPLTGIRSLEIGRGTSRSFSGDRLEIPDQKTSTKHARIVQSMGRYILEDLGSKNGTLLNGSVKKRAALVPGDLIRMGRSVFVFHTLDVPASQKLQWRDFEGSSVDFCSVSPRLDSELNALCRLAETRVPLSLVSPREREPERLARAVHRASRRTGTMICFEQRAIDDSVATVFVDQLNALSAESQIALLRLLEDQTVQIIVATDAELQSCAEWVRSDLIAALSARVVRLPALRQRREDLGLIIGGLTIDKPELQLTADLIEYCFRCEWPLDVAELRAVLMAAAKLADGIPIDGTHLSESNRAPEVPPPARVLRSLNAEEAKHREQLVRLLESNDGNISAVARELGKARTQVQRWLRRYEIVVPPSASRPT